jgi:hypothetical protein
LKSIPTTRDASRITATCNTSRKRFIAAGGILAVAVRTDTARGAVNPALAFKTKRRNSRVPAHKQKIRRNQFASGHFTNDNDKCPWERVVLTGRGLDL